VTGVLLLSAALLAGDPGTSGTPLAPTPGSWVLVQTDGSRVVLAAPPEARGGRWVGRLEGTRTLVSIPASRVDAAATARANAPEKPADRPSPRFAPTPRPFETPPLGDRVKLKTAGNEARKVLEGARSGTPPSTPTPGASPVPEPEETEPTDRAGRGESWWRDRAGAVRGELEEATRSLAQAEASLEAAERAYLGESEGERATFVIHVVEARERAERAREEHRRAAARLEALQEEARKAGAFPGWLR
jgi:hypothetical protein